MRPAGGSFTPAVSGSPSREGRGPEGETPKEKEEREISESFKVANGAQAAVDGAGDATVVWSYFNGTDQVVQTAVREAGGSFTSPLQVSESGADAGFPAIDIDAAGNVTAVWVRIEGTDHVVQVASRQPGGSFSAPGAVSDGGGVIEAPSIDVAPNGAATVLWRVSGLSETFLQTVSRPPGGAFEPAVNVNSGKDNPLFADLAADGAGDSVVVWSGENGADQIVRAAVRGPGAGTYTTPVAISQSQPRLLPSRCLDGRRGQRHGGLGTQTTAATASSRRSATTPAPRSSPASRSRARGRSAIRFSSRPRRPMPGRSGRPASLSATAPRHRATPCPTPIRPPAATRSGRCATDGAGRTTASTATLLVKARNFFKVGKLKTNPKKGTGTLTITFPEPGAIVVSGKGIKKVTVRAAKGGSAKVPIKAAGKGRRRLGEEGQAQGSAESRVLARGWRHQHPAAEVTLRKKPA